MSKDKNAEFQRNKALDLEKKNPRQAIDLLVDIINNYKDTRTVANLVLDDIVRIGKVNGFWKWSMSGVE